MADLGMTLLHHIHGTIQKQNDLHGKMGSFSSFTLQNNDKGSSTRQQMESTGVSPTNLRAHTMVADC